MRVVAARVAMLWLAMLAATANAQPLTRAERIAVDAVRVETIRDVTTTLAAPSLGGRLTGTAGGEEAARLVAERFARAGLRPLGDDGTFFHAVRLVRVRPDSARTSLTIGGATARGGTDFALLARSGPSEHAVTGDVLLVAGGAAAGRDTLPGDAVRGAIVVLGAGRTGAAVRDTLARRGAAAFVLVDGWPAERAFADFARPRSAAVLERDVDAVAQPPVLVAGPGLLRVLFGARATFDSITAGTAAGPPVGRVLARGAVLAVAYVREPVRARNVVGVLPGRDGAAARDGVLLSAHYDALGTDDAGRVRAGAVDNALGVGMLVAAAEALGARGARPARSVVFAAFTGEEQGMLGATEWAERPPWALTRIAAALNFDGIGTETFGPVRRVVGFGAELSSLGATLDGATAALGMQREGDPMPAERPFFRSDQIALARRGVPALMLLGLPADSVPRSLARARAWLAASYHQPGDTVSADWSWTGPADLSRVGALLARRVAEARDWPAWAPGAPFRRPEATDR